MTQQEVKLILALISSNYGVKLLEIRKQLLAILILDTSGTTLNQSPIATDQIPRVQQIGRPPDYSHRLERGNDLPLLYKLLKS